MSVTQTPSEVPDHLKWFLEPPAQWPDDAPSVSMDVSLGKQYRHIAFDQEKYNEFLDEIGVPKEDRAKLDIRISGDDPMNEMMEIGSRTLGEYREMRRNKGRGSIRIRFIDEWEPRNTQNNKTLLHESQHFADDVSGELKKAKKADRKTAFGSKSIITGTGLTAVGAVMGSIPIELLAAGTPVGAKLAAGGIAGYAGLLTHIAKTHKKVVAENEAEKRADATMNRHDIRAKYGNVIHAYKKHE